MTRRTTAAAISLDASWETGEQPQVAPPPSTTTAEVYFHSFEVVGSRPLPGGVSVDEFVRQVEAKPGMSEALARARARLAADIEQVETLRRLRLAAGLSQARLAERAGTTQAQIALIESGARDPQTDMITRLAQALDAQPARVFDAIRAQRCDHG